MNIEAKEKDKLRFKAGQLLTMTQNTKLHKRKIIYQIKVRQIVAPIESN